VVGIILHGDKMTEIQYYKPDPIPKFEGANAQYFIQNYQQAKKDKSEEDYKQSMLGLHNTQTQLEQAKLDSYSKEAPLKQAAERSKLIMDKLNQDKGFKEKQVAMIATLNPDSPTFDEDVVKMAQNGQKDLIQNYGVDPETAASIWEEPLKNGTINRESVRFVQEKQGLRRPDRKQIVDGKIVDMDSATSSPIEGIQPGQMGTQVGKLIAARDRLPEGHPDRKIYDMAIKKESGGSDTPEGLDKLGYKEIASKLGFTPESLDYQFERRIMNPNYQPFGKFKANSEKTVLFENALAQKMSDVGLDPSQVMTASAGVKADVSSLMKLQTAADQTNQAVEQSKENASLLREANTNYKRTGYPAPNKFLSWADTNLSKEEKAKFDLALLAFSREYMRVVTGAARSVSELSVGGQATADDILSKFSSWEVLNAKIEQAQKEIENVPKSYETQINEVSGRIKKKLGGADTSSSSDKEKSIDSKKTSSLITVKNPKTGEMETWDTSTEQRVK
jgi:hypothetical protein